MSALRFDSGELRSGIGRGSQSAFSGTNPLNAPQRSVNERIGLISPVHNHRDGFSTHTDYTGPVRFRRDH